MLDVLDADPNADTSGMPTVTLAGRPFFIAPLPLRQSIAISKMLPDLNGPDRLGALTEIVRRGLLKVYPQASTDDLLDRPITMAELAAAIPVIVRQAGGQDAAAGEAPAASPSNAPTGADSSLTS